MQRLLLKLKTNDFQDDKYEKFSILNHEYNEFIPIDEKSYQMMII